MAKRSYSDEEKAAALLALDAAGGNASEASRQVGIPRPTINLWKEMRAQGKQQAVTDICQERRPPLAERLEALVHLLVDAMPEKVEGASLREVAIAAGISIEKMQLLRGEPTSVVKSDSTTDTERALRIAELLDRGRARGAGLAPLRPDTPALPAVVEEHLP